MTRNHTHGRHIPLIFFNPILHLFFLIPTKFLLRFFMQNVYFYYRISFQLENKHKNFFALF